ncbi:MAG: hypothetical protein KBD76_08725 [Bacteriovorax sp.]|nr:hypothetical protein [Bacteriovorax sp.]
MDLEGSEPIGSIKEIYTELENKGYIFDPQIEKRKYYKDLSFKNGLHLTLGNFVVQVGDRKELYRHVDVQMVFEKEIGKEYSVNIFNKIEQRLPFLPQYNLQKTLEWGLKNIPKCVNRY